MAVDERQWRDLYDRAERALGSDGADTLMALLPPVGWADVATKRDLEHLRREVRMEIETSVQRAVNVMTWRMLAMFVAFVGLLIGLGR